MCPVQRIHWPWAHGKNLRLAVRLALGAQRASIIRLVLISGVKLGVAGCVIGAIFITRLLRSLLFQVDSLDPMVLVSATVSILVLAISASVIPARRAASVEPLQALRTESPASPAASLRDGTFSNFEHHVSCCVIF